MQTVKLYFETNFNNKLFCDAFIHISLVPEKLPPRGQLDNYCFYIVTADNSHQPVTAVLMDILIVKFEQITDLLSFCSHGIDTMALADYMFKKHHPNFSWDTHVAIYFYKKFNVNEATQANEAA